MGGSEYADTEAAPLELSKRVPANGGLLMRVPFKSQGQADRYLKTCEKLLSDFLTPPAQEGARLPSQKLRNALCRGFGYGSYYELKRSLAVEATRPIGAFTRDDLIVELEKSFTSALPVGLEYGFTSSVATHTLVQRLARRALLELQPSTEMCNRCGLTIKDAPLKSGWLLMPAAVFPFRYAPVGDTGNLCSQCVEILTAAISEPSYNAAAVAASLTPRRIDSRLCLVSPPEFKPGEREEFIDAAPWDIDDYDPDDPEAAAAKLAEGILWMNGVKHGGICVEAAIARRLFDDNVLRNLFAGRGPKYYFFNEDDNQLVYYACPDTARNEDRRALRSMLKRQATGTVTLKSEAEIFDLLTRISRTDEQIRKEYFEQWSQWHESLMYEREVDEEFGVFHQLRTEAHSIDEIIEVAKQDVHDFDMFVRELEWELQEWKDSLADDELREPLPYIAVLTSMTGGSFKHTPCNWLLDEALRSTKEPDIVGAFTDVGRLFAEYFSGIPVILEVACDATQLHRKESPYGPNTLLVTRYAMDGRIAIGEIRYKKLTNGRKRAIGDSQVILGQPDTRVIEAATNFMRGWVNGTNKAGGRAQEQLIL